jgi:primary-amine oxidase
MTTVLALVLALAHPLEPLTADEHLAAFAIVRAHPTLPDEGLLFPFIALREPPKSFVKSWTGGSDFPRQATVHVLHPQSNRFWIVVADLRASRVTNIELAPAGTQPAVTLEEYGIADEIVRNYGPWQAAMRARGLDPDLVYLDVWAPGDQELPSPVLASLPHGANTRLLRALSFHRGASVDDYDPENPQNPYARPIEGVVVTIDMNSGRVAHMTDSGVRPVPTESGNAPARRTGLKPMTVIQPNGGGFEVADRLVHWQNWSFYAVLHPREGLVLYDVRYDERPIAYRMSLSEIYVPYGLADENWSWRTAFDVGEYNLGLFSQTLEKNADVPEHTFFFDAVFGSDLGETIDFPDTIGMYERDNGILWTRTDPTLAARDTRGRRELVLTWNAWIGDYIYGFDWIFGMDGGIEVKVTLAGTTLNRGEFDGSVSAPNHQHFFSFRLDLDVDGTENEVHESNVRHIPTPGFLNAFGAVETQLTMEGFRDADPLQSRTWEVGKYAIETKDVAVPLSSPLYEPLQRAAFASHPFWVTRFRDDERYAAGDFPNQGKAGEGLQSFVTPPESIENADVVVWQTIGMTHVTRPEDLPVMPSETIGFKLVPHGFFARNPALDAQELPAPGTRRRAVRR